MADEVGMAVIETLSNMEVEQRDRIVEHIIRWCFVNKIYRGDEAMSRPKLISAAALVADIVDEINFSNEDNEAPA